MDLILVLDRRAEDSKRAVITKVVTITRRIMEMDHKDIMGINRLTMVCEGAVVGFPDQLQSLFDKADAGEDVVDIRNKVEVNITRVVVGTEDEIEMV